MDMKTTDMLKDHDIVKSIYIVAPEILTGSFFINDVFKRDFYNIMIL